MCSFFCKEYPGNNDLKFHFNPFSAKDDLACFGRRKWQNDLKCPNLGISRSFGAKWMCALCSTFNFEFETTSQAVSAPRSSGKVRDFLFFTDFLVIIGYSVTLNVIKSLNLRHVNGQAYPQFGQTSRTSSIGRMH